MFCNTMSTGGENMGKNNKKLILIISGIVLIIIITITTITRNNMTPEETVSRFMYLVENKNYEEAKKLCNRDLDKLDMLSNLKPSNLTFDFSEDKKNATAIILEDGIETTNMNIVMKNSLLGWKIYNYEVVTDLIEPQVIEDKIIKGEIVSDIQLLYWGESNIASKEEITKYAKDNAMVTLIFLETMKAKNYDKANEMYKITSEEDLTIDSLKEYDWNNYEIVSNYEIIDNFNNIIIKLKDKKIWIYVAGKEIVSVKEATI